MQPTSTIEPRFLIVDADAPARKSISNALQQRNYQVSQAASGSEAIQQLYKQSFVAMLFDPLQLGMNELEMMQRAREIDHNLQFIILTAHPTIDSTIAAIRANVFDYLLKPCSEADLAKVFERALQLQTKQTRQERLLNMVRQVMSELEVDPEESTPEPEPTPALTEPFAWLELDREKRMVTLQTTPPCSVELTDGEIALLSALMEKPNHVLTCAQLAQNALGYNGMDKWTVESVIRSSIFRLRQKLEPSPQAPKLIHTVRGRGYYFAATA